ncbi:MAG TPA: hypothetical protein VH277_07745 [Gemmatimonadaceae bacterium]|jgi:hypothetical protein|nr:hypothetical protein [Gemmatimonadaceae bacterium]
MPETSRDGRGLRTIFSFFLGLMLAAFVGVGVYTFHPPPTRFDNQIRDLSRREQAIRIARAPNEITSADRDSLQVIERRRDEAIDAQAAARLPWGRSTAIALIVFATLAMAVSLTRAENVAVVSNGLLLGGVFTMLYGVGWIIATDTSVGRFVVITVALAITLVMGYARFVRRGAVVGSSPRLAAAADDGGLAAMDHRITDLELRLSGAALALANGGGRPG